jgi:hypothetical protein
VRSSTAHTSRRAGATAQCSSASSCDHARRGATREATRRARAVDPGRDAPERASGGSVARSGAPRTTATTHGALAPLVARGALVSALGPQDNAQRSASALSCTGRVQVSAQGDALARRCGWRGAGCAGALHGSRGHTPRARPRSGSFWHLEPQDAALPGKRNNNELTRLLSRCHKMPENEQMSTL